MKKLLIIFLFAATQVNAQIKKHQPRPVSSSAGGVSYTTLDPAKNSTYITLSGGNLIGTDNSGATQGSMTLSVLGKTVGGSGTVHCEFTFSIYDANVKFGLSTSATSLNAQTQNNDAFSWSLKPDGFWINNNGFNAYSSAFIVGDVVGMDLNLATGAVVFSKNGTGLGTAFTLSAATYYVSIGFYNFTSAITVNFGATAFTSNPTSSPGWF